MSHSTNMDVESKDSSSTVLNITMENNDLSNTKSSLFQNCETMSWLLVWMIKYVDSF